MPNLVTHALFCEDVMKSLNDPVLNRYPMFAITGSQGPDFLFFYHTTPTKLLLPNKISQFGHKFHEENVNAFYASALESIRREKKHPIQQEMIAYLCGHLCHWAMDSTFHPYVYYRTGNYSYSAKCAFYHHRFESLLDAAMLKYNKNTTITDYDPGEECLSTSLPVARAICRIYIPAIQQIYDTKIEPTAIVEALQDWKTMQKIFRDPKNLKKGFLQPIEKALGLQHALSGFSIPNVCEDNVDICNLLHKQWKNPASLEESNASLFDLYKEAQRKAITVISYFLKAINDPKSEEKMLEFIGDRNYEMGLPNGYEMKEFDIIDLSI